MKVVNTTKLFSPDTAYLSKDIAFLGFRVLVSLAMINTHGIKKVIYLQETIAHIPDPFGIGGELSTAMAILANIICPILVIMGLATRLAILPILGVTMIGFFIVHAADPWSVKDIPLIYSLAYMLIFFIGPGKYSLDYKIVKL